MRGGEQLCYLTFWADAAVTYHAKSVWHWRFVKWWPQALVDWYNLCWAQWFIPLKCVQLIPVDKHPDLPYLCIYYGKVNQSFLIGIFWSRLQHKDHFWGYGHKLCIFCFVPYNKLHHSLFELYWTRLALGCFRTNLTAVGLPLNLGPVIPSSPCTWFSKRFNRAVIHLPASPMSQTHKFLIRRTNFVLQMSQLMSFPLLTGHLTGCSDRDPRKICYRPHPHNQSFFHIKQKIVPY